LLTSGITKLVGVGSDLHLARHTVWWFCRLNHVGGRCLGCSVLAKTGSNNNQSDNNDDDEEASENDKTTSPIN
jgi:hypothetical protein